MKLWSDSWPNGERIPARYACGRLDGADGTAFSDNVNPHLAWSDLPAATQSLVLICYDFDVPSRGDDVNQSGREIPARATSELDRSVPVVAYCWGPGCNGATRAALALAGLGFRVREMIGGFEYWAREGLPVETADGVRSGPADPLTAPAVSCGC